MGILFLAVCVLSLLGEGYVWHEKILWHGEGKRDPRNFRPPY
ncbi:MAG TPA: hypothetical protein VK889_00425 [Solirubrobacterales bacterium]|nr:hypothetical protein [Solirubrobacterales bacterium]